MSQIAKQSLNPDVPFSQKVTAFVLKKLPSDIVGGAFAGLIMSLGTNILTAVVTRSAPGIVKFLLPSLTMVISSILCFPLLVERRNLIDAFNEVEKNGGDKEALQDKFKQLCEGSHKIPRYIYAIVILGLFALTTLVIFYIISDYNSDLLEKSSCATGALGTVLVSM